MSSAENERSAMAVLAQASAGGTFSIGRKPDSEKTRSVLELGTAGEAENERSAMAVLIGIKWRKKR